MKFPTHAAPALFLGSALLLVGCSGGSGSSNSQLSSALLLSVTTRDAQTANLMLPTPGSGTLDVAHAWFHVGRVELAIETKDKNKQKKEKEGDNETEKQGQHGSQAFRSDDHDDGDGDHGEGDHDDDGEMDEIVVRGPFTFDVAAGRTVIESVPVQPGTIRRASLGMQVTDDRPFDGASIVLEGRYQGDVGDATPFTLRSVFVGDLQVPIANGGIVVDANMVVPVELAFDLGSLVAGLDFRTATVEDGEIRIDATHNFHLLMVFALGLQGCVGAHERDD